MKSGNRRSIEERVKVAKEALGLIRKISGGIRRDFYLKLLAEKLDLPETALHEMLGPVSQAAGKEKKGAEVPGPVEAFARSEVMVVSFMIHHPELIPTVSGEKILDLFESPGLKKLAEDLDGIYRRDGKLDLSETLEALGAGLKERLYELVFHGGVPEGDPKKALTDCFQKIREDRLKRDKRELLKRIREAERGSGGKELEALLMERQRLAERERTLQSGRFREN